MRHGAQPSANGSSSKTRILPDNGGMTTTSVSSAISLLQSLSVAELQTRLAELTAEEKALRTILRSLKARERERVKAMSRAKYVTKLAK